MDPAFKANPTYEDVLRFFESLIDYEKRRPSRFPVETRASDLEHFRGLLEALGRPQACAPVFHIAGTKGKGSTCALLASMLTEHQLRTGLYTSPHIESYCERILVNGSPVEANVFARLVASLAGHFQGNQNQVVRDFRTVFELLTAAAFVYFSQQHVDAMVVETGLGGRLDATNVFCNIDQYLFNIITSIGLDHTEILGDTPAQIAGEKAGIFQPRAVVIVGDQFPAYRQEVHRVLQKQALQVGVKDLIFSDELIAIEVAAPGERKGQLTPANRAVFRWRPDAAKRFGPSALSDILERGLELEIGLPGPHQLANTRTALVALLAAERECGWYFSPEQVRRATSRIKWPGRFEIVIPDPPVIVDGAHCELSTLAMARTYSQLWGQRPTRVVMGIMQDKDAARIVATLLDSLHISAVYCCSPPSPRGMPAESLATLVTQAGVSQVHTFATADDAVYRAWEDLIADREGLLCFGSFYLVAPYCKALRAIIAKDEKRVSGSNTGGTENLTDRRCTDENETLR